MLDDATFFTPVRALGAQLRARKLTSLALTEGCLDRLERLGPRYNAVVTLMRESALEEARRADVAGIKPCRLHTYSMQAGPAA